MRQHNTLGGRQLVLPLALFGLVLAPVTTGCQPDGVTCQTGHGEFAVKLDLKSGTGECSELIGGVYGVQTYNEIGSNGLPDALKPLMAIKAEDLGVLVDDWEAQLGETPDPVNKPYAIGDFSTGRPTADICMVPTLVAAKQVLPTIPAVPEVPDDPQTEEDESEEAIPAVPGMTIEYAWKDLKFVVTPSILGTVFVGTLTYTVDGCTAEYEAVGLYPAVYCDNADGEPDDNLCAPEANIALGIPLGSGINPDFKAMVKCHPELLLCMFEDGKLPAELK